jgi:hypothetical protein
MAGSIGFEVLAAVILKIATFLGVMLCNLVEVQRSDEHTSSNFRAKFVICLLLGTFLAYRLTLRMEAVN